MFDVIVRRHRQRLGLTQEELADHAGVGLRTVRDIETGRTLQPRQITIRRLAEIFGLDDAERALFHELGRSDCRTGSMEAAIYGEQGELENLLSRIGVLERENTLLRASVARLTTVGGQPPSSRLHSAGQSPG